MYLQEFLSRTVWNHEMLMAYAFVSMSHHIWVHSLSMIYSMPKEHLKVSVTSRRDSKPGGAAAGPPGPGDSTHPHTLLRSPAGKAGAG